MSKLIVNQLQPYSGSLITFVDSTNVTIGGTLAVTGTGTFTGGIAGTLSTAAQTNITSVGTLSSLAVSGNLTVDTNTLFVDSVNNRAGLGTSSPIQLLHLRSAAPAIEFDDSGFATVRGRISSDEGNLTLEADYNNSRASSHIGFNVDGAERARFTSTGLKFPNGNGIDFSASAGGGATSSLLDDYEEGTWTPVLSDLTNDATPSGAGFYTKIGRMVYLNFTIQTSSLGSVSGSIYVTGLPFTSATASSPVGVITTSANQFLNVTAGQFVSGRIAGNKTEIELWLNDSAAGMTFMQASEWSADGYCNFTGYYFV